MPTDRAEDTEAIRAARDRVAKQVERVKSFEDAATTKPLWIALHLAEASAELLAIHDRLVARLEAAERRLEQQIDEAVGRWHETCPHEERSLHEWLGLTWDEYADFVQHGVAALAAAAPGETEQTP